MYSQVMETATHKAYTVALVDAAEVSAAGRISAEVRFITALERALGGPEDVARTYRAWMDAHENAASDVDADSARLAVRWPLAFDMARQAGLRDLGELPAAHFSVRLERSAA